MTGLPGIPGSNQSSVLYHVTTKDTEPWWGFTPSCMVGNWMEPGYINPCHVIESLETYEPPTFPLSH